MDVVTKFYKSILLKTILFFRKLTTSKYLIRRVLLEYESTGEQCDTDSTFWKNEERFWDSEYEENSTNITCMYIHRIQVDPPPSCVSNLVYRITYYHNNSIYKYITRNPKHQWPPKKVPGFNPLIKEAWAEMFDGSHQNVTERIKKFAGPNSDFHGETIHLRDMFGEQCVNLRLVNLLNQETIIKDEFSRRTLWVN